MNDSGLLRDGDARYAVPHLRGPPTAEFDDLRMAGLLRTDRGAVGLTGRFGPQAGRTMRPVSGEVRADGRRTSRMSGGGVGWWPRSSCGGWTFLRAVAGATSAAERGAVTRAVLDLAAPSGVVSIDASEGYVRDARRRLTDRRAHLVVGDGTARPVADAAVAEIAHIARPGGTVAASVWDYAEGMELIATSGTRPVRSAPAPASWTRACGSRCADRNHCRPSSSMRVCATSRCDR